MLCFNPVDEDSCCQLVAKKSQNCDKVGRATKSGQNIPGSWLVVSKALVKSMKAM